jgi:DNA primase
MMQPRRFEDSFLAEIRQRTSLTALVGSYVRLARAGREMAGLCPFHGEKTPSFTVTEDKGFWKCFGCGASGDAFGFLMKIDGLDFVDAVERLAEECGLKAPAPGSPPRKLRPIVERPSLAEIEAGKAGKIRDAREIIAYAQAPGPLLGVYWHLVRRIRMPIPASIRFEAALPYKHGFKDESGRYCEERGTYPAMVAPVRQPDGKILGVHRTWLKGDGSGKAQVRKPKKAMGIVWNGAIRLSPPKVQMILGEGIETTASGADPFWDRDRGCAVIEGVEAGAWATISLGNLCGAGLGRGDVHPVQPAPPLDAKTGANPKPPVRYLPSPIPDPARPGIVLPPFVERVIILADDDNGDPHSFECQLERARARFCEIERRSVLIARPDPGTDFNRMAQLLAEARDREAA